MKTSVPESKQEGLRHSSIPLPYSFKQFNIIFITSFIKHNFQFQGRTKDLKNHIHYIGSKYGLKGNIYVHVIFYDIENGHMKTSGIPGSPQPDPIQNPSD